MKNFNVGDICDGDANCYFFVVAVAKRARDIYAKFVYVLELRDDGRPVELAVQEFMDKKWTLK